MKKNDGLKAWLRQNSLQITLQLVGVVIVLLNLWLATKLAPMAEDIQIIKSRVQAIESTQPSFVRKDEFNQIIVRLDKVSDRLDQLIAIHIGR